MGILNQLSCKTGDSSGASNRTVAGQCLEHPEWLPEIVAGLGSRDDAMVADCAEVMTEVAKVQPAYIAPYAGALVPCLMHRKTRARWEAMHALALVTFLAPEVVGGSLHLLQEIVEGDSSVIVRDYGVDAIANYAGISGEKAREVYPFLVSVLDLWNGKQAGHALRGLLNVVRNAPELRVEVHEVAVQQYERTKGVIRKAARELMSATA